MRHSVAEPLLAQLSARVAAHLGLHFPPARWRDLARGIAAVSRELAFQDEAACIRWLTTLPWTQQQVELLAGHLTIGETYFFRGQKTSQILQEHILPALIASRRGTTRHLRLWSAGCATGEEPYSLAILLHALLPDLHDWQVTLLATDVNPRALEKAAAGVYGAWSFRSTPPRIQARYFKHRRDGRYEILPAIKNMVTFAPLNLATATYPSLPHQLYAMDAIFCRNVLLYFTPAHARSVVHRLYHTLAPGGWLFVSPSETSHTLFAEFTTVDFPDVILYQKADESPQVAAASLSGAPPPALQHTVVPVPTRTEPSQEALALYEQGRSAEAIAQLVALCSCRSATVPDMALLARAYANQGEHAAACKWIEQAIAADKTNATLHYLHAIILQEQGDLDAAIVALKRVLYLDQNLVLAHVTLGNLTLRQHKGKEAARHFANARSLLCAYQPDDVVPEAAGLTAGRLMALIDTTAVGE
jgi:chemotaxis protein methyltransferase CheR